MDTVTRRLADPIGYEVMGTDEAQVARDHTSVPFLNGGHDVPCAVCNLANTPAASLAPSYVHKVPHIRQLHTWDCGLACVVMVLRSLGCHACTLDAVMKLCPVTSVWTVDLAYLLRHFGVDVCYLTLTLGANPAFAGEVFYKDNMHNDIARVNDLFRQAGSHGIHVYRRSLELEEIQHYLLTGRFLAIVLVDKYKLRHSGRRCQSRDCDGSCRGGCEDGHYVGHYIVVSGYESRAGVFHVQDPDTRSAQLCVSAGDLDKARRSFGTDEDIILVSTVSSIHS